jgi:hypothetical protein
MWSDVALAYCPFLPGLPYTYRLSASPSVPPALLTMCCQLRRLWIAPATSWFAIGKESGSYQQRKNYLRDWLHVELNAQKPRVQVQRLVATIALAHDERVLQGRPWVRFQSLTMVAIPAAGASAQTRSRLPWVEWSSCTNLSPQLKFNSSSSKSNLFFLA